MDQQKVFLAIVAMTAVTYLPRLLPALLLSGKTLPPMLTRWLRFVPVAVLSTLLGPTLLLQDGHFAINSHNLGLMMAVPTSIIAFGTRSFLGTLSLGVVLMAATRYWLSI
jgi:branched-subunit amino acid transport protein